MKVGTDGVLLGAWARCDAGPDRILDIGSGTGLIALMLAQRFPEAQVDAVEFDPGAFGQSAENFARSPWKNRLTAQHSDFKTFGTAHKYGLIVSNPPFHTEDTASPDASRQMARSAASLSYEDLLKGVSCLLREEGGFHTIVPFKEEQYFLSVAAAAGLFPQHLTRVWGRADKPAKRSLIALGFVQKTFPQDELIIEISRHQYTAGYIRLTRDFYWKML